MESFLLCFCGKSDERTLHEEFESYWGLFVLEIQLVSHPHLISLTTFSVPCNPRRIFLYDKSDRDLRQMVPFPTIFYMGNMLNKLRDLN